MDAGGSPRRACADLTPGERELAESIERYRSLFTLTPHAAFSVDLEGRYTAANAASEELTGLTQEQMKQVDYSQVLHPEDLAAVDEAFHGALAREPRQVEARVVHVDGSVREVKITAIPVVVAGEVVGVHGIGEDVTEANRLRHELEEAHAAKVVFLANVSHEVRTPLTSVLGAAELLLDEDLDPAPSRFAEMVHRSCRRLERLVNDILDFARLEAGKVVLRAERFSVRDLVDDLSEWAGPLASSKGLPFTCSVAGDVSSSSLGDSNRISQVLINLLENAVKFTAAGAVDLVVSAVQPAQAGDTSWVRFDVRDTGSGIARDKLDTLFDPFTQVDPSTTRAYGGVGLGLAICRDLASLMGGRLETVSSPGEGSTFSFLVPLSRP